MNKRLADKIAIVTGAGCVGPGGATAALLRSGSRRKARRSSRWIATSLELEETLARVREIGGIIEPFCCDMTDSDAVARMVAACTDTWGGLHVLVNNVGGSAPGGPAEMSEEVWDAQVDLNLKSVFLACKHALPIMERYDGGAIVNIASTSGLRWTGSAQVAYAATKAGVIQLSRVVAVQYAGKGIRVNTVVPGQLHTPMVEARLARQRAGGDVEALLAAAAGADPAGLHGRRHGHRPTQRCSWPPTRHGSSPAPNWWSTAA